MEDGTYREAVYRELVGKVFWWFEWFILGNISFNQEYWFDGALN
jgi:hypothetical protein